MSLRHCRYWIFDMDGTLTVPVHDFDAIRAALGIEPGRPILEAIEQMPTQQAAVKTRELHRLELEIAALATPQPGALETLQHLHDRGYPLGILTRNAEDIAAATLLAAGLEKFFPTSDVIGRDSCAPKPDPAGVLLHLQRWQAPKAQAAIVGDFVFDLDAGKNAGITTVHFDSGGEFRWPQSTDVGIRHIDELIALSG